MGWTRAFGKPEGKLGHWMLVSMNVEHTSISKWGLAHYDWQPDTAALDIGCGGGMNLKRMLKMCPQGRAAGIDIAEESVIQSKRLNIAELGRRCTVKRASADAIPFENDSFDVATAFETVYFWPDLPKAFAEVLRVLKPGGSFLVVCEVADPDTVWKKMVEGMNVYSTEHLKTVMESVGFVQVETDNPNKSKMCVIGKKAE